MRHAPLALLLLTTACGTDRVEKSPATPATPTPVVAHPLEPCVVDSAPADTVAIRAVAGGLIVGGNGTFSRHTGAGCALAAMPGGVVFAMEGAQIETDLAGNVYVMPARSSDPAVLATEPEVDGFSAGIVRVDASGQIEPLVQRGRWIAGFSIAPDGDELTVYGCAATGLHKETSEGWEWDQVTSQRVQEAGVLGETAVAVGGGAIVMATNGALVRVTAEGAETVGESHVIFGAGQAISRCGPTPQAPRLLSRCDDELCGVFTDGIATWTMAGALSRVLSRDDIDIADDEAFVQVSGDEVGLYLLLRGPAGARVMFVPTVL